MIVQYSTWRQGMPEKPEYHCDRYALDDHPVPCLILSQVYADDTIAAEHVITVVEGDSWTTYDCPVTCSVHAEQDIELP